MDKRRSLDARGPAEVRLCPPLLSFFGLSVSFSGAADQSLLRQPAERARTRTHTDTRRCDVLQWWGAGIACRCTAHFVRVRACTREWQTSSIPLFIHLFIHPFFYPFIHSLTHAARVDAHSPIWTLLGNAPIVSPQKLEKMSRKQPGGEEEALILVRLHPAAPINAAAASRGARKIKGG